MNGVAQGCAGLALVMTLGLLWTRQAVPAAILLTAQSAGVALAAVALGRPLLAVPPVLLTGLSWMLGPDLADGRMMQRQSACIVAGAVLVVLCRPDDVSGVGLAVVLLSLLFAGMRGPWVTALISLQNGIVLMAGSAMPPLLLPVACLVLPLPLVIGRPVLPGVRWSGWIALGLTACLLAATLVVRLDGLATVFAPLLAFAGTLRAWDARKRRTTPPQAAMLSRLGFSVLAVSAPVPAVAWIAVILAIGCGLAPALPRQRDTMAVALAGAGLALVSLAMPAGSLTGELGRLIGSVLIAGCVPALAVPLVVLLVRPAGSPEDGAVLIGVASAALLACALFSGSAVRWRRLAYAAMAALSLGLGQADGVFGGIVLLVLLVLTDASVPAVISAELVLLPGVLLVALAASGTHAWLLVPLGAGLVPTLISLRAPWSLPRGGGLLPLGLAAAFGWCCPPMVTDWLRALAAGGG